MQMDQTTASIVILPVNEVLPYCLTGSTWPIILWRWETVCNANKRKSDQKSITTDPVMHSMQAGGQLQGSAEQPQGSAEQLQGSAEQPQGSTDQPQGSADQPQGSAAQPQGSTEQPQASAGQRDKVETLMDELSDVLEGLENPPVAGVCNATTSAIHHLCSARSMNMHCHHLCHGRLLQENALQSPLP